MSPRQISSTPPAGSTSIHETAVKELTRRICRAVDDTKAGFDNQYDANAHCFLPKTELTDIFDTLSLQRLIRELIILPTSSVSASADGESDGDGALTANLESTIREYVQKTIGRPPRLALLALFLYDGRPSLRTLFMKWLSMPDFPSDNDMPLNDGILEANDFPDDCYRSILNNQNIFRPILIRQDVHQQFRDWDRLPYIGKPEPIKDGSSGSVYSVRIARGHWEINNLDRYIPGNPDAPLLVAIKVFRDVPGGRSREEATEHFRVERDILNRIRKSRIKHEMVMLDLGSITILDGASEPVSHSLMFKLATFSLEEFLKDERRYAKYRTKNVLFEKLVDIVEALAYLHHHLDILHLDIKPDNILVFERGTSRQDNEDGAGEELVWKLSDFGLAREKNTKARLDPSGRNSRNHESLSSEIEAVRHAGPYQAPEVQERDFSGVGGRSDVWSMGCVTLMVLAFMTKGVTEVEHLWNMLPVDFQQQGGRQRLFYHKSDSYSWGSGRASRYAYMADFDPDIGDISSRSGPLQAAVNPRVILWSNMLHDCYADLRETELVGNILQVIFRRVLLINRSRRITASDLAKEMAALQVRWKTIEQAPDYPYHPVGITDSGDARNPRVAVKETPEPPEKGKEITRSSNQSTRSVVERPLTHSSLCRAITSDDDSTVLNELTGDDGTQSLEKKCGSCKIYPIHKALHNKAYKSLKILVEKSDPTIAELSCQASGGQTAVELASQDSGDSKALEIFLEHHTIFNVTEEFFNGCRGRLDDQSKASLKKLWKRSQTQPGRRSFLGRWR